MNGNPYYRGTPIPNLAPQIMQMGEMSMRNNNLAEQRLLEREKMGADQKYREEALGLQKQQLANSTPASKQPWNEANYSRFKNRLIMAGLPVDKLASVLDPLEQMAKDPVMMRGDVADAIEGNWDTQFKPQIISSLGQHAEELAKKLANPDLKFDEQKKLKAELERLEKAQAAFAQSRGDMITGMFFKDIVEERANSKAALAALKQQEKPDIIPSGAIARYPDGRIVRNPKPTTTADTTEGKPAAGEKPMTEAEKRAQRKEIVVAEEFIIKENGNAKVLPYIDLFNSRADKPYCYVWEEGRFTDSAKKVMLPKIKGKQVTAQEVYFTAEKNGVPFEEVLEQIMQNQGKK